MAIEMGFELHHLAELVGFQQTREGEEVCVPSAILIYRQEPSLCPCKFDEFPRFSGGWCERLLDHNIFTIFQR